MCLDNAVVNVCITFITNFLILYLCYNCVLKSALFHSVILEVVLMVSEMLSYFIMNFALKGSSMFDDTDDAVFTMVVLLSKIFYFMISHLLAKVAAKEFEKDLGKWALLLVLPLSSVSVVIFAAMLVKKYNLKFDVKTGVICIVVSFFMLIANIVVYAVYAKAQRDAEKLTELELSEQRNQIDFKYMELLQKKNDETRKLVHDYKKHLEMISNISESEEVHSYVEQVYGKIQQYEKIGQSDNRILDVVLSKYSTVCQDMGIEFSVHIISENLMFVDSADLSALMNNLLDNAVEAAAQSPAKTIDLEIARCSKTYAKIEISNSCVQAPKTKSGTLFTHKSDKEMHGFGTKIINRIVTKYSGETSWKYDDENAVFTASVFLPEVE